MCRAITQTLISRKICIIHGARRVPRTIFREGRRTSATRASVRDRPLENSPLLEFVCSMWSSVSPGGWGAFRRTRRVHLKYLNGLILSIESPRPTGRDETTLTLPRRFSEFPMQDKIHRHNEISTKSCNNI